MKELEKIYLEKINNPSDINEHLFTLKEYASQCSHITEFGVRGVVSTYAFMMGGPNKLISYDIHPVENFGVSREYLKELALSNKVEFHFLIGNTLEIEIEPTELLFIDTWHKYGQLKEELKLHSNKVSKYLIFHDTTSYEFSDEGTWNVYHDIKPLETQKTGLWPAIEEFLNDNNEWVIKEKFTNNNGLTILKNNNEGANK